MSGQLLKLLLQISAKSVIFTLDMLETFVVSFDGRFALANVNAFLSSVYIQGQAESLRVHCSLNPMDFCYLAL